MTVDWKGLERHAESVGPGWRPLVLELIAFAHGQSNSYDSDMEYLAEWERKGIHNPGRERVEKLKEQYPVNPFKEFTIDCVKEKFGGLRVGASGDEMFIGALIYAEMISGRICENCGRPGDQTCTNTWIKTMCDSCRPLWDSGKLRL